MNLKALTKSELEEQLGKLFLLERNTSARIIAYLTEISRRRSYLDQGYTSLFTFLTKKYHHPPATAQRWIDCIRMTQTAPEILGKLETGELNQTQVSLMS